MADSPFEIVRTGELAAIECPCGTTRRAFLDQPDAPATLHIVEIDQDARTHYHKWLTEIYYILEGNGYMELDGSNYLVGPGDAILIQPGCRHRAVGSFKILNVVVPKFDSGDEWFD